ncbi:MAG TPA: cupin domain-containing protein [Thermodesulfobacteriota bacterium]|nr:cupin domain-containing protein [Thermodesulfobacteriota bacterium]
MDLQKKYKSLSLGGHLNKFYMKGEDTGGAYTLFEANLPPMDIGPPPHIHRNEDVAFYILEGKFTFSLDENEFKAEPGDFVFLPRNRKHWLRNESDCIGKMLVISSPAGFEKFYDATGITVEDDTKMPPSPTHEELMRLVQEAPNYGIEMFL